MYLVDTDVISEARKGDKANPGVRAFFGSAVAARIYLSVITVGEIRQGIERLRHRGDSKQADVLEQWLNKLMIEYDDTILPFDLDIADIWGRLRVSNPENPLDKQIAATALIYNLTLVTRNVAHYTGTGVQVQNPFT
jgi:predicted nucleic acid-binding protein